MGKDSWLPKSGFDLCSRKRCTDTGTNQRLGYCSILLIKKKVSPTLCFFFASSFLLFLLFLLFIFFASSFLFLSLLLLFLLYFLPLPLLLSFLFVNKDFVKMFPL